MKTPLWICNDASEIAISQMSDEHIVNVLRYLRDGDGDRGPMVRPGCSGFSNAEWIQLLTSELRRRARQRYAFTSA